MGWSKEEINQQSGKHVIITGANKDSGLETALALAEKDATVILAVSDLHKGRFIQEKIKTKVPNAKVDVMYLNLYEIASIRSFIKEYKNKYRTLSILILNESIQSSVLQKTKEGFESQFGVNFLAHFALTGLLLDLLKTTPNSRVITLGNKIENKTKLSFGHFKGSTNYKGEKFYTQSKLASMLFAKHLDEKLKRNKIQTLSICCQPQIPNLKEESGFKSKILKIDRDRRENSKDTGALPILFAATEKSLVGGEYIGVSKNKKDSPTELHSLNQLYNENVAHNLWQISEKICGVTYHF